MKGFLVIAGTVVLILLSAGIQAAPAPPGGGGPGCWPPPCVPVDGGLAFLAVAGAAYGAKKLFFGKKNS